MRRIYNVIGTIDGHDGIGLHGSAKRWVETLADGTANLVRHLHLLAPAHGDDQLERFATEVIPDTRELTVAAQ
jgi:hypothetical protein